MAVAGRATIEIDMHEVSRPWVPEYLKWARRGGYLLMGLAPIAAILNTHSHVAVLGVATLFCLLALDAIFVWGLPRVLGRHN